MSCDVSSFFPSFFLFLCPFPFSISYIFFVCCCVLLFSLPLFILYFKRHCSLVVLLVWSFIFQDFLSFISFLPFCSCLALFNFATHSHISLRLKCLVYFSTGRGECSDTKSYHDENNRSMWQVGCKQSSTIHANLSK